MKQRSLLATTLIACLPLLACTQSTQPPANSEATAAQADKGFVAKQLVKAFAEARKELREGNLSLNNGIQIGRKHLGKDEPGLPKAEITPAGELLIDGKAVATDAAQREALLAYRSHVIGIAEAGMEIGAKGVDLAGTALKGVAGAIMGGEKGDKAFEARMEAEGKKLEAEAMKLCQRLPALLESQQVLANSLPDFKPYATMSQADIDDCEKGKDKARGVAVTSP